MSIRRASSVTFVSRVVTVVVTVRCRQFVVSSSSCLPSVGCRKRVVRSCQDPRCDAMFQRPFVSTLIRSSYRSVSIRSSRTVRFVISHRLPLRLKHDNRIQHSYLTSINYRIGCISTHLANKMALGFPQFKGFRRNDLP